MKLYDSPLMIFSLQILWTLIMKFRDFIFCCMYCFIGNILLLLNSNFEKESEEWLLCWTSNSCLLLGSKMTIMYYNNKKMAITFHLWRKILDCVSFLFVIFWNGMKSKIFFHRMHYAWILWKALAGMYIFFGVKPSEIAICKPHFAILNPTCSFFFEYYCWMSLKDLKFISWN